MPSEQIERPIGGLSVVPEKLQLEINLRLLTLGLVFLPILLALGFWQLDRADEKRRLLEIHQAQQLLDPISLNSLNLEQLKSLIPFTKVQANAEIEEGIYWLLDNRINRGRVGYEVLQVAKVDGSWLLINRGWVEGSFDRSVAPVVQLLSGEINLFGQIAQPSKNIMMADVPDDQLMAERIVEIDLTKLSAEFGHPVTGLVQLAAESQGALVTDWPTVNISPMKHQGYAFQWFSMAFALVVLLLVANTNLLTVLRQKTSNNK